MRRVILILTLLLAICGGAFATSAVVVTHQPSATPTPVSGQASGPAHGGQAAHTPEVTPAPPPAPPAPVSQTPNPAPSVTPPAPATPPATPRTSVPYPEAPVTSGKAIVVDLSQQRLYTFQDGQPAFTFLIESGRDALPTPTGEFTVFKKAHPITFVSPWPKGSPYWYYDTTVQWAMEFEEGGFYLHDAWWVTQFGPGNNTSHGCVGMSSDHAKRLYEWTPLGTPVIVQP